MPAGKNIAVDISWWWMGIFHSAYCGFVSYTNGGSLLSKVISYQVGLLNQLDNFASQIWIFSLCCPFIYIKKRST